MQLRLDLSLWATAVAIFSMFFGAGNVIFPLLLGVEAEGQLGWAFFGLVLTAIGGPLLGLTAATLFRGRCVDFFMQAGRWPCIVLMVVTLGLLGPFAVLPRCVTVSYAAVQPLLPSLSLFAFAICFGLSALFCCWSHRFLLPTLGYVLSPLLIGCLLLIIYQGSSSQLPLATSDLSAWQSFSLGFTTGYDTMDLIAAIYFSAGIWNMIGCYQAEDPVAISKRTLLAGMLGCLLLGLVYFGLAYAAAQYAPLLQGVPQEEILIRLAALTIGPQLAVIANSAVALACFTTVISLTMTIGDIICGELLVGKVSHRTTMVVLLAITTLMANLGFSMIMEIIHPAVAICYPLIILLTIANLVYKLRSAKLSLHSVEG